MESNLGIGAMLNLLGGNASTVTTYKAALGKTIKRLWLDKTGDNALCFEFEDGTGIVVTDGARSCCESRYMRTDDNLEDYIGATLDGMEIRDAPDIEDVDYGVHEVQFLAVQTSKGQFVMSSHNEHNGYYGGISIVIRSTESAGKFRY